MKDHRDESSSSSSDKQQQQQHRLRRLCPWKFLYILTLTTTSSSSPSGAQAFSSSFRRRRVRPRPCFLSPQPNENAASNQPVASSKNRAISALSQPATGRSNKETVSSNTNSSSNNKKNQFPNTNNSGNRNNNNNNNNTNNKRRPKKQVSSSSKRPQPSQKRSETKKPHRKYVTTNRQKPPQPERQSPSVNGAKKSNNYKKQMTPRKKSPRSFSSNSNQYSSLLPPLSSNILDEDDDQDDPLSTGLSSWEEFLGVNATGRRDETSESVPPVTTFDDLPREVQKLPSIEDLFPTEKLLANSNNDNAASRSEASSNPKSTLDGVLPVSALFYRSQQTDEDAVSSDDEDDDNDHDDEELPFSAEQSDAVSSDNNMIQHSTGSKAASATSDNSNTNNNTNKPSRRAYRGRKLVRRGMEMLVGGVPIFADPPQRGVELYFHTPEVDYSFDWAKVTSLSTRDFGPLLFAPSIPKVPARERGLFCEYWTNAALKWDVCPADLRNIVRDHRQQQRQSIVTGQESPPRLPDNDVFWTEGESVFEINLSAEELELATQEIFGSLFGRAFRDVIEKAVNARASKEFTVDVPKIRFTKTEDGFTGIHVAFRVEATQKDANHQKLTQHQHDQQTKLVSEALEQATDGGDIALELARVAQTETRWPENLRERIIEECLMQDDDEASMSAEARAMLPNPPDKATMTKEVTTNIDTQVDMWSGSGPDGVFPNFSAANAPNAPYGGAIGLRLLEAAALRARDRLPRVIAIGDVHGCIDELQDLLRECDYRPGDLVVFLGDLVCKGPDSVSVVQMAREIGAIGVRGNHDFEVVRWHQAIQSGVDPPVVRSEHYHIASCLSKADMKWLHSLPWYVLSSDLNALFVHAGFVSGIRLAKQNPRLMMNMRSILPDGTVTSKFFNNWPWARLWDGPQTVYFGHDADRGLQQYEHAIGLDTGCVYGGRLTACILPEKRLVSVRARHRYFRYKRKHYD